MKQLLTIVFIGLVFGGYTQLTDQRDGKTYKTVKIGNQVWMAENLAFKPSSGNYWAYDDDNTNVAKYGYLYDWETACKVCPTGWHLPSDKEWTILIEYLGGKEVAGRKMKNTSGWPIGGNSTNETNNSGFSGLPGGYYSYSIYHSIGATGFWWSSTQFNTSNAWSLDLHCTNNNGHIAPLSKIEGLSVRCIKD